MDTDLPKQRANIVITGASRGIGAAIARAFAAQHPGCILWLLARSKEQLRSVADACAMAGADARVLVCDVTESIEVDRAAEAILKEGTPTCLINNAGAYQPGSLDNTDVASLAHQIDVNVLSAFRMSKAFLPAMASRGSGLVVMMASIASVKGYPGGLSYCVAKHALLGLGRVLREEMKDSGVAVTNILPGATFTPSWEGVDVPEERFMPAEDIARAVVSIHQMSPRTVVEEIVLRPMLGDL